MLSSACLVLVVGVAGNVQSQTKDAPIGVDEITRMLAGRKQWVLYWDRAPVRRPRLGSTTTERTPSVTLEFTRVGPGVIGHAHTDEVHHAECDFDVAVRRDGFVFSGCWGSDKTMTYDPDDRDYPFKGRVENTLFWLAPSGSR